jgi:hypothetical protein
VAELSNLKMTPEQQKELDDLEAAFDAELEKHQGHGIIKVALKVCTTDEGLPWRPQLHPDARRYLEDILVECNKDGTIGWATHGLIAVANYLDSKKAGKIAYEILSLANDTVIRYDLVARQETAKKDWTKRNDKSRQESMATTGASKAGVPAKVGDKAPEGTLRPDQITPKGKRRL